MIPTQLKAALALATLLAGAVTAWNVQDWRWTARMEKARNAALATLNVETEKARSAERRNTLITEQLERTHAEASQRVDEALATNRRLVRELGGLRDPGRRVVHTYPVPGPAPASREPADQAPGSELPAESEGVLSEEASEFILGTANEADRAATYAATCYHYVNKVIGRAK